MNPLRFIAGNRIRSTQFLMLAALAVLLVTRSRWDTSIVSDLLLLAGLVLVGIGSLGRLWCSLYIAGYKDGTLITEGPYSVTRNPLYFFSLVGAVGVGFATETFTFAVLFAALFAAVYPAVIRAEEARLAALHGAAFEEYRRTVPRLVPSWRLLREPASYVVRPVQFRKHLFDALWFIWLVGVSELIEALHDRGFLAARWLLP